MYLLFTHLVGVVAVLFHFMTVDVVKHHEQRLFNVFDRLTSHSDRVLGPCVPIVHVEVFVDCKSPVMVDHQLIVPVAHLFSPYRMR